MKKTILILVSVILNSQFLVINCLAKGIGTSAVATLTQPVSAKVAAMGEAYTAIPGDVAGMHYNPASIAFLKNTAVSMMYERGMAEDTNGSLLFGTHLRSFSIAASALYYTTGKIELYDSEGTAINKIGQQDMIVTLGAAKQINRIGIGLNVKGISSQIFGEKTTAFAADLGAQYRITKPLTLGIAAQNMGTAIKYIDESESLPQIVRVGAAQTFGSNGSRLTVAVDMPHYIKESDTFGQLGLDYTWHSLISLRAGYKQSITDSSRKDEQKISAGVGFQLGNYGVDYAMGFAENLDAPQHISLYVKF
jgi:hypothetical protein